MVAVAVVAGCTADVDPRTRAGGPAAGPADAWSIETGEFAFQSNVNGTADVFVKSAAGSAQTLVADTAFDGFVSWAPDGLSIVFDSDRPGNGNRDLFVLRHGDAGAVRLTDDPGFDFVPAWSPDGEWIAFVSTRDSDYDPVRRNVESFRGEIYRIRPDGSGIQRLTRDEVAHDQAPAWSADGTRIAWCREIDGAGDIWIMDADGGNPHPLIESADFECTPRFSPDGRRLAWRATRGDSSWIMTADVTGASPSRLDLPFQNAWEPAWSPDSRWICFTVEGQDLDIHAVLASGGDPLLLAGGAGRQQACAWRPLPADST